MGYFLFFAIFVSLVFVEPTFASGGDDVIQPCDGFTENKDKVKKKIYPRRWLATHPPDGKEWRDLKSYEDAKNVWSTPNDPKKRIDLMTAWLGRYFRYDKKRARDIEPGWDMHSPEEMFTKMSESKEPDGVCMDLSQFGVETFKRIIPEHKEKVKYLKIRFKSCEAKTEDEDRSSSLGLHWMTSIEINGQYYFTADSKQPDVVYGPYDDVKTFVHEYAEYRGRELEFTPRGRPGKGEPEDDDGFALTDSLKQKEKRPKPRPKPVSPPARHEGVG